MDITLDKNTFAIIVKHDPESDAYYVEGYHTMEDDLDDEDKFFYAALMRGLAWAASNDEERICLEGTRQMMRENGYDEEQIDEFDEIVDGNLETMKTKGNA